MFIPGGCFCCEPPEDPCTLSGCTWSSTDMSDTDLTAGTAYYNPVSGVNPDGDYEITNAQETGTGNDAPCRKITIETVEAPQKPDTVYAICWKDNATHNPSTQCPLTSVSFCVESKRHGDSDSGLTDSVVFVVRQNNRIFATAAQSVGVNWKRASGTYTQGSFTEIDGAGNPDFTAAGTSIEFGFALKLLVSEDEEPLDVVMFDNLCITKNSQFCVTCNNGCDAVDEGASTLTPIASSGGVAYSGISSFGNPGPSHRFTVSANGEASVRVSDSLADMLSADCKKISAVAICIDVEAEGTGGGLLVGSGVGTSTSPSLQYSVIQVNQPGWLKIERVVSIPSNADLSALFLAVGVRVNSAGTFAMNVYIDNICVKAVYNEVCRQSGSVALDLAGLSLIDNGCNDPAAATYLNGVLSSTIVLNWNSAYSNASRCGYVYLSPVFNSGSLFLGTRCTWWISVFLTVFTNGTSYLQIRTTVYDAICTGNINVIYAGTYSGFCEGGSLTPSTSGYEGSNLCPCVSVSGFSGSSATWEPL